MDPIVQTHCYFLIASGMNPGDGCLGSSKVKKWGRRMMGWGQTSSISLIAFGARVLSLE
jgi:hypothetical protein